MIDLGVKFIKIRDVETPQKAHITDLGIDFFVPRDLKEKDIKFNKRKFTSFEYLKGDIILIPSGIKMILPKDYGLVLKNRGSIPIKKGLIVGSCVIDEEFRGEIFFNFIALNNGMITPGEKIVQGIIMPNYNIIMSEIYNEEFLEYTTKRGEGMLGSTNKENK